MRRETDYDLVFEFDYPLGESSELAYDTWARDITDKVGTLLESDKAQHRVVRNGNKIKIVVVARTQSLISPTVGWILRRVGSQCPADMVIHIHEREPVPVPAPDNQMTVEEMTADA